MDLLLAKAREQVEADNGIQSYAESRDRAYERRDLG